MRVAYVCLDPGVPIFGRKGSSIHCQAIMRALQQRGAEIELFANRLGDDVPPDLLGIPTHRVGNALDRRLIEREQALIKLNPRVRELLNASKPFDLIYERHSLWSFSAMQFAHEQNIPGILEINSPLIQEQKYYRTLNDEGSAIIIRDQCFQFADSLIAVSEQVAEIMRETAAARHKTTTIPNGVDCEHFCAAIKDRRDERDPTVIGFVGTLKPWHGVSILLDAFAAAHSKNPKLSLKIVGAGPEEQKLKNQLTAYCESVQRSVTWLGAIPNSEIPAVVATFDIAVAPYPEISEFYFSPLKILEYMAAGRPIVASRIGQIPDLIQHDITGRLVAPGNVEQLAAELLKLSTDSNTRARLGLAARKLVEVEHSWQRVVDRILRTVPSSKLQCEIC